MRRLYDDELKELQEEFIAYLVMNGIDAEEWVKIKREDMEKAEKLILEFSFFYFQSMLPGIAYMRFLDRDNAHCIHFGINKYTELVMVNRQESLIAYKESEYEKNTSEVKFDFLEQGFKPSDGTLYKELALMFAKGKK